jgi:hypothetical protein
VHLFLIFKASYVHVRITLPVYVRITLPFFSKEDELHRCMYVADRIRSPFCPPELEATKQECPYSSDAVRYPGEGFLDEIYLGENRVSST